MKTQSCDDRYDEGKERDRPAATRRLRPRVARFWFYAPLLLLPVGTVMALSVQQLPSHRMSIFNQATEDVQFSIESLQPAVKGKDRIDVKLTLKNTDAGAAHSASVTLQLLDATGSLLAEQVLSTGDVAGGGSVTLSANFVQANVVGLYASFQVIVTQTG